MSDLEAIRKREAAATKGPWTSEKHADFCGESGLGVIAVHEGNENGTPTRGLVAWLTTNLGATFDDIPECEANGDFIAHARADVPALLAEIDRLRALKRPVQP